MTPIHIQLISGRHAGRRLAFSVPTISFGRQVNNTIVLDNEIISRNHGELRFAEGQWVLVNHSSNGTLVNRKRVTDKPCHLHDRDVITVGGQRLFQVMLDASDLAGHDYDTVEKASVSAVGHRKRLWISIGAWNVLAIALVIFGFSTKKDSKETSSTHSELTAVEIEEEIRQPIIIDELNYVRGREERQRAGELFYSLGARSDALFEVHQLYKSSLAYLGRDTFEDGLIQRQFLKVQDQLIAEVIRRYKNAYALFRSGQHSQASESFRRLTDFYQSRESEIYKNIQVHWTLAGSQRRK